MNTLQTLNPEDVSEAEYLTYPTREAARAVVFDSDYNVALLFVSKGNHYKLPGGGKETDESFDEALQRECREEIGCDVEITGELGSIVEYRKFSATKQVSHCYTAKVLGNKGTPQLTQNEINKGYTVVWVAHAKAVELLQKNEATNLEVKEYIVPRDVTILKEV